MASNCQMAIVLALHTLERRVGLCRRMRKLQRAQRSSPAGMALIIALPVVVQVSTTNGHNEETSSTY